ncbi:MAG: TfoX/Sxy family protein [Gemmatimonadetes bacterium]|nr:TfoX/Sxy family protein [Gemmatimonadota bacterium]
MASPYLERLSNAVGQATTGARGNPKPECKHFFSGAALYVNGMICASLTPAGFAVKLPDEERAALLKARRARRLRYFRNGPVKKEYVVLSRAIVENPIALKRWLTMSIDYVRGSPSA